MSDPSGEFAPLVSKREGRRTMTWSELFPDDGHVYLTDDDEVEAVARAARQGQPVVLSPLLAMEFVCDWRNMRAALTDSQEARNE